MKSLKTYSKNIVKTKSRLDTRIDRISKLSMRMKVERASDEHSRSKSSLYRFPLIGFFLGIVAERVLGSRFSSGRYIGRAFGFAGKELKQSVAYLSKFSSIIIIDRIKHYMFSEI